MSEYSKKLLDPRWQKKRLKILERDNFACQLCHSTHKTLHIHHLKYKDEPWDIEDKYLTTTCFTCHSVLELLKGILDVKIIKYLGSEDMFLYAYGIHLAVRKGEKFFFYIENVSKKMDIIYGDSQHDLIEHSDFLNKF